MTSISFVIIIIITMLTFISSSSSVGGAFALGTYTILFLKLYSYKDVNMWCRKLSTAKAKKLARSLSCKFNPPSHDVCICIAKLE